MNSERQVTTLFMLMSSDGKMNSGNSDELDVDTQKTIKNQVSIELNCITFLQNLQIKAL